MRRSTLLATGTLLLMIASASLGLRHAGIDLWRVAGGAAVVEAQDTSPPPTTHGLFTKLLSAIGVDDPNGEITSEAIFHASNRNLYIYVYQQIFDKPEREALLELSTAYGLTPTDAESIIYGSYTPLLRGKSGSYSQDRAISDMNKIQQSYARILQYQQLQYKLGATVASTEIFSNGSLDDSSFDLVHDLDIIEQILFVGQSPVTLGQKPFKDPTSKGSTVGTASDLPPGSEGGPPITNGKGSGKNGGNTGTGGGSTPLDTGDIVSIADILKGLTPSTGSINACEKDSPLNKALDTYDTTQGNGGSGGSGGSGSGGNGGSGTTPPSQQNDAIGSITAPELMDIVTAPAAPIQNPQVDFCSDISNSTQPGNTPNAKLTSPSYSTIYTYPPNSAKHIFCLTLDTRSQQYSTFYPKDTCIQCMVAAMDDTMKKLLSRSLTPNKLTGNAFESSKCSSINLVSMLDLNIFMIPVPVVTPPKLGPFVGHDIAKEWDRYVKRGTPFGSTPGASAQRVVTESTQNLDTNTSQMQLINEINTSLQSEISAAQQRLAQQPISTVSDSRGQGYQQVIQEMRVMTSYFQSFKETFSHFYETACKIPDKPTIE